MTAERGRARELVAELRCRGIVLTVDLDSLGVTFDAPPSALTPELWAEWTRLSVDVTAELLAEVATVAAMVQASTVPAGAGVRATVYPAAKTRKEHAA